MKKALVGGALIVALGLLVKRFGARMFEHLPDDAPPKWMFRNIATIRENTDRILEILDPDRPDVEGKSAADS
jgi:hypothetical protein